MSLLYIDHWPEIIDIIWVPVTEVEKVGIGVYFYKNMNFKIYLLHASALKIAHNFCYKIPSKLI